MKKVDRYEIFIGADSMFRWRFRAKNGEITADGAQGYTSKGNALKAVKRHREKSATAPITVDGVVVHA